MSKAIVTPFGIRYVPASLTKERIQEAANWASRTVSNLPKSKRQSYKQKGLEMMNQN